MQPSRLYRVMHDNSPTKISSAQGIQAKDQTPLELPNLHYDLAAHFNWQNKQPTRFISVFDNKSHAFNWARKLARDRGAKCWVVEIDVARLCSNYVPRRASSLIREHHVPLSAGRTATDHADELLVLHQIPVQAIIGIERVGLRLQLQLPDNYTDKTTGDLYIHFRGYCRQVSGIVITEQLWQDAEPMG